MSTRRNIRTKPHPNQGYLWSVHLDLMAHTALLFGYQSMLWGGDMRCLEAFEQAHDKMRERCPSLHAELVEHGHIMPIDPPEVRRAQQALNKAREKAGVQA